MQSGLRDVSDLRVSATLPITGQSGAATKLAVHSHGFEVWMNLAAISIAMKLKVSQSASKLLQFARPYFGNKI